MCTQEGGARRVGAAAAAGHHQRRQHGRRASGALGVAVRAVVLRDALPHLLPGFLHRLALLLLERRGKTHIIIVILRTIIVRALRFVILM